MMNESDLRTIAAVVAPIIKDFTVDYVAPLLDRIAQLEGREPQKGEPGRDGKDVDPAFVIRLVDEAVAAIPRPENGKDGRDGIDGKDGAPGKIIDGEHGRDGKDGIDGKDGENGKDGKDGAPGERGTDGIPGRDGKDGIPGIGKDGERGLDGRDGQPGVPGRNGDDGAPGKDGEDGLGFDDLTVTHDGARTVTLRFARGEKVKEFPIIVPALIDKGVWRDGAYEKGDGVTWGGSYWIAQDATTDKPGEGKGWRLAVKRGRKGTDAVPSGEVEQ